MSKSSWENNRVGFDYFGSVGIALKHYVRFVLIYGKMWLGKTISNKFDCFFRRVVLPLYKVSCISA